MVLIVDDNVDTAHFLLKMLQAFGMAATEVHDASDALRAIQRDKPSLIILDLMMPGLSGLELLKLIRARFTSMDLPTVIYSADWEASNDVELHRLGIADFIPKGSGDFDRLLPLVQRFAANN